MLVWWDRTLCPVSRVRCPVSRVPCPVSRVPCLVSRVPCFVLLAFFTNHEPGAKATRNLEPALNQLEPGWLPGGNVTWEPWEP